jgi:hypothetical protein
LEARMKYLTLALLVALFTGIVVIWILAVYHFIRNGRNEDNESRKVGNT